MSWLAGTLQKSLDEAKEAAAKAARDGAATMAAAREAAEEQARALQEAAAQQASLIQEQAKSLEANMLFPGEEASSSWEAGSTFATPRQPPAAGQAPARRCSRG